MSEAYYKDLSERYEQTIKELLEVKIQGLMNEIDRNNEFHATSMIDLQQQNKQLEAKVRKLETTVTEIVLGADEAKAVAMELHSENKQLREALSRCCPYTQIQFDAMICDFCGNYDKHESDCLYIQLTKEAT